MDQITTTETTSTKGSAFSITDRELMNPARAAGESYDEYRARRIRAKNVLTYYLKNGTLFWDSSRKGTYVKSKVTE